MESTPTCMPVESVQQAVLAFLSLFFRSRCHGSAPLPVQTCKSQAMKLGFQGLDDALLQSLAVPFHDGILKINRDSESEPGEGDGDGDDAAEHPQSRVCLLGRVGRGCSRSMHKPHFLFILPMLLLALNQSPISDPSFRSMVFSRVQGPLSPKPSSKQAGRASNTKSGKKGFCISVPRCWMDECAPFSAKQCSFDAAQSKCSLLCR